MAHERVESFVLIACPSSLALLLAVRIRVASCTSSPHASVQCRDLFERHHRRGSSGVATLEKDPTPSLKPGARR